MANMKKTKTDLVSIFFDLEKAYDTTWKYGILKDLKDAGLKGRLPLFISGFLNDWHFKVRLGSLFLRTTNKNKVFLKEAYFLLHFLALK
jgi:hypothetical protein